MMLNGDAKNIHFFSIYSLGLDGPRVHLDVMINLPRWDGVEPPPPRILTVIYLKAEYKKRRNKIKIMTFTYNEMILQYSNLRLLNDTFI